MPNAVRSVALEGVAILLPGGHKLQAGDESRYQVELRHLCGEPGSECADIPTNVILRREPDKAADPDAVQLVIGGHPVGYLDPYEAKPLAPLLDALKADHQLLAACRGRIVGGYTQTVVAPAGKERGQRHFDYQVELDLAPIDEVRAFLAGDVTRLETFDPSKPSFVPREGGKTEPKTTANTKTRSGCLTVAGLALAVLAAVAWGLAPL
jgi:hypothetical protein